MTLNILKANSRITELEAENKALLAKCEGFENEVTNLKNMSKDMTEAQAEHNSKLEALTAEHEKALLELKASYEAKLNDLTVSKAEADTNSGKRAAEILASVGVEQDKVQVSTGEGVTPTNKKRGYTVISHLPKNK